MAPLDLSHYPESAAVERWGDGETYGCSIVLNDLLLPVFAPYYCGYVRFNHPPLIRDGTRNLGVLDCVPVHGGITSAVLDPDDGSMVYGFDCNHAWDQSDPKDLAYARVNCDILRHGVILAGQLQAQIDAGELTMDEATNRFRAYIT